MVATPPLRGTGMLLLLGVILFSVATIVAEPFEQVTPLGLYQAIAQYGATYQLVNYLAGLGFVLFVAALALVARPIPRPQRRLSRTELTGNRDAPVARGSDWSHDRHDHHRSPD